MRGKQQGNAWRAAAFCLACQLSLATATVAAPQTTASAPRASRVPSEAELRFQDLNKQLADGLQEVQSQRQKVAEELKAAQKDLLDAQRKSIDWWFAALAVLTTVVAALGALLPYLMGRKDKELLQSELQNARDLVASIRGHAKQAAQVSEQLAKYQSGAPTNAAERSAVKQEAQTVKDDPAATAIEKLRARAVLASQVEAPTTEQAEAAYELWLALSVVDLTNASAHFNAGYWAQELFERSHGDARVVWFSRIGRHYASALAQDPAMHDAAFNWGLALEYQAQVLAPIDLAEARRVWAQAGEKYAQALAIKADDHKAAANWGFALTKEACVVAPNDLAEGRRLWARAGEKYAQALAMKADEHEAAYSWGTALSEEARAVVPSDLGEGRRLWAQARGKYAQALAIKADRHEAAYSWGNALSEEARAVATSDLAEARQLWAQAGEKYAQALAIKADKYEAASNWGNALSTEAHAVASSDLTEGRRLWAQAGERYARALAIKADEYKPANNWGIALSREAWAVAPRDLAAGRQLWAQAGEKYARALAIKADNHEVANNWGNALSGEAEAVATSDLAEARWLWAQAGEKFALALAIKGDMPDAANNWGSALLQEGQALALTEPAMARAVWQRARELLERHSTEHPDGRSVVAYNLACAYALCGDAVRAVEQLTLSYEANVLPDHWREDKDLDPIRSTPEFQTWVQQRFPS